MRSLTFVRDDSNVIPMTIGRKNFQQSPRNIRFLACAQNDTLVILNGTVSEEENLKKTSSLLGESLSPA